MMKIGKRIKFLKVLQQLQSAPLFAQRTAIIHGEILKYAIRLFSFEKEEKASVSMWRRVDIAAMNICHTHYFTFLGCHIPARMNINIKNETTKYKHMNLKIISVCVCENLYILMDIGTLFVVVGFLSLNNLLHNCVANTRMAEKRRIVGG